MQPPSRSLWLAGTDEYLSPALEPPTRAEVLVVGAGISGLATALMLVEAGVDVAVVDTRGIAHGATGHSSAKVSVLHELTAARIAKRRGESGAADYIDANRFGFDWITERVERDGIDCDWQRRTAVTYLTKRSSNGELLSRDADLLKANGVDAQVSQTLDMPFAVESAISVPDQAQFDPVAFARGLADRVADRGGTIVTDVRVSAISDSRSGATISTNRGDINAGSVVVATGLPFLDRGLLFARAEPESSYVLACVVEADHPDGMYLSADGPKRSLRTAQFDDDALLLVGGESHKTGQGGDTEERYAALARWTDEHFGLRAIRFRFMTQDFMTPDHVPYAGPILPGSEVLVATGMNKWGFTNGVAAAAVNVARILDQTPPGWAETFSPTRLPLKGIPDMAKANANVALHMVGGWLGALTPRPGPGPTQGRVARSGLDVVAVSNPRGEEPCRVSGVCPHLGGILSWNPAEQTWDCPLHGSRFERHGRLLHAPAVDDLTEH